MEENNILSLKEGCTGCSACANVCPRGCIRMQADGEGFCYPEIDTEQCIRCGLCEKICPVLSGAYPRHATAATYAVLHKDTAVWEASSSGGAFSALCEAFFQTYPDGKVYGAAFDGDHVVRHCAVERLSDIDIFRKSKYVQSEIGSSYQSVREDLRAGKAVLFSGTPCQIGGLHAALRAQNTDRLFCVDLVCHGVGSPKVFRRHLEELEQQEQAELDSYRFRMRTVRHGVLNWHCTESRFTNGKTRFAEQDPYVSCFIAGLCLRPSCGTCAYATSERPGDITLGDLKGKHDLLPKDRSLTNWSVLLCNTPKGAQLFEAARQGCTVQPIDTEKFRTYSPPLVRATPAPAQRSAFFALFSAGESLQSCARKTVPKPKPTVRLWMLLPDRMRAKIKRILRRMKGSS